MTVAEVRLWGRTIGAVAVDGPGALASFEYTEAFAGSGIEVAPLMMPLARRIFRFPNLSWQTFQGLPGMLADALPDRFGHAVIDAWLAAQGRLPGEIDAVERLCTVGRRGMGALEFEPARGPRSEEAALVDVERLVGLASRILAGREALHTSLARGHEAEGLLEILRVGASAGGARAKAVIAWNPTTNEVRSGQVPAPPGFVPYLLKFDGVGSGTDPELTDSQGFGAIEYAYALMARASGITISDCRLLEEGGRRHFMTRRFDRTENGDKLHLQSLAALGHFDFNAPGAHSYEQAALVLRRMGLGMAELEELFRRAAFNIVARNQDDHVKNLACLMDRAGRWRLSPAYDLTFSYNPNGVFTALHQMSLNQKRDGFVREDFREFARTVSLKRGRADALLDQVLAAVRRWPEFAAAAQVSELEAKLVKSWHRLEL